jgi:hypothetical protein
MAAKLPYFVLHFTVCLVWKLLFTYMIIIILDLFHNSSMNQFRAIVRPYFTYFDACTFGACIIIILPPMPPSILTAHPNKLHVLSFAALRAVMWVRLHQYWWGRTQPYGELAWCATHSPLKSTL